MNLQGKKIVIAAPMSLAGSLARARNLIRPHANPWIHAAAVAGVVLLVVAWSVILAGTSYSA